MAEVTSNGFVGKTIIQYKAEIETEYLDIDSDWNINPESLDGQMIGINSEMYGNLDDQIGLAYSACDPYTASGQALWSIGLISGVRPQSGTFSTAVVTVGGVGGTVIPQGSQVRDKSQGTVWTTQAQVVVPSAVNVICDTAGAITAAVNSITEIVTPIAGWQTVTNGSAAVAGSDSESDAAFRVRRNESVGRVGSNQIDSMYGNIANVVGVSHLFVDENFTKVTDSNGLDPNSEIIFVTGGDENDIATAIAEKKNPGCGLNADNANFSGQVQINTFTPTREINGRIVGGSPFLATFFRPESVNCYVSVEYVQTGNLPANVNSLIQSAIIEHSNATLFTGESPNWFDNTGFSIGESVPAGKLHTPVNKILGGNGYVNSITVGDSASPTGSILDIDYGKLAVFDETLITVTKL